MPPLRCTESLLNCACMPCSVHHSVSVAADSRANFCSLGPARAGLDPRIHRGGLRDFEDPSSFSLRRCLLEELSSSPSSASWREVLEPVCSRDFSRAESALLGPKRGFDFAPDASKTNAVGKIEARRCQGSAPDIALFQTWAGNAALLEPSRRPDQICAVTWQVLLLLLFILCQRDTEEGRLRFDDEAKSYPDSSSLGGFGCESDRPKGFLRGAHGALRRPTQTERG